MPNYDIFYGSTSGSAIDWSTGSWSGDNPPTASDTVQEHGAGTESVANLTIGGLDLDNGASLTVDGSLTVTGATDSTFGGGGSTITVAGLDSAGFDRLQGDASVTSAVGTVSIDPGGVYVYEGSGAHQTINSSGGFFLSGSDNKDTITINDGINADQGSDNAGIVHVNAGGLWDEFGTNDTTTVDLAGGGTFGDAVPFSGLIENLGPGGEVVVADTNGDPQNLQFLGQPSQGFISGPHTVTLDFTTASGTDVETLKFDTTVGLQIATFTNGFEITRPVCFAAGTLIATTRGEVPVEDLAVGDLVVTASGQTRPIVWLGHRRIEAPRPDAWPVRVMAGAFGEGLPARDLRLSPGHAVCVDVMGEVLVPVHRLANGVTIFPEPATEVTYWHVELASHDVLLADGLPCESYMDAGNRGFFGRQYGRLETLDPDRVAESLTRYARPFVDAGPVVEAIRERLAARAARLSRREAA